MLELKANTEVKVRIGSFVDATDGVTPETGITLGAADQAELLKHGSDTVVDISAATWAAVADCAGWYVLTLTAAHTDTEGQLDVIVQDASECLPVVRSFEVLSQAAYDSKYAEKDAGYMDVNLKAISEDTTAADILELFIEALKADTGQIDAGTLADNTITADSINTGALTADAFAADALVAATFAASSLDNKGNWNVGKTGYALTAVTGLGNQTADITGSLSGSVNSVATGVTLANGAITDASLAGNMEIVFETDFGTNYNTTRNAWATNVQDFVGTTAADPFGGFVVAASVTGGINTAAGVITTLDGLDTAQDLEHAITQAAIAAIGSGTGAALNFAVDDDNSDNTVAGISLTAVGTPTGTYALTLTDDTNAHVIASADVAGTETITWAYGFSVGAGRSVSEIVWKGILSGAAGVGVDTFTFSAYNWTTTAWDSRLVVTNTTGAAQTLNIKLLAVHTGTGANEGKVALQITFAEADAGTLSTRFLLAEAQQSGSLVGYAMGAIWVNTAASNTNVVPYVDGTADNPVSTWAAALTLSGLLGINRFKIAAASSITLTADSSEYELLGDGLWNLALGGQDISNSFILKASVSGIASGSNTIIEDCQINPGVSTGPAYFVRCGFNTTVANPYLAAAAGQYIFVDCVSIVAGSGTPYFNFAGTGGVTGANFRRWSGGSHITGDSNVTGTMEVVTGGGQTLVTGGGSWELRGICREVTITLTGSETVRVAAVTGPIAIGGAGASSTVNLYGVHGVVANTASGTPTVGDFGVSLVNINTEADTALTDYGASTHSAADVVDEWETQSQADPTGFHVNVKEWNGTGSLSSNLNPALGINTPLVTIVRIAAFAGDSLERFDQILTGVAGNTLTANITGNITGNLSGSVGSSTSTDAYLTANLGLLGAAATALAPASTALSNAVWTPTKAGYLDAAISGVSGLDAAGVRSALGMASADLDTQLDAILVQATAAAGASGGTGARTVAITVDDGTTALESARVRVTKGAESYLLSTDTAGLATFNLDDGSWVVAITLAGYVYGGTTLVVDGDETETYSMTAAGFTPSTQPDSVTIQWLVINAHDYAPIGSGEGTVTIRIKEGPGTDGYAWGKNERSATTDANGMVEFANVPVGATIRARLGAIDGGGEWFDLDIPTTATSPYDAGEIIGDASDDGT